MSEERKEYTAKEIQLAANYFFTYFLPLLEADEEDRIGMYDKDEIEGRLDRPHLAKGLSEIIERAYMESGRGASLSEELILRMKQKGIDTTHLE